MFANGISNFFCGKEKWWNIFDLAIILLSLLETILDFWVPWSLLVTHGVKLHNYNPEKWPKTWVSDMNENPPNVFFFKLENLKEAKF